MRRLYLALKRKDSLRCLLAALFLVILLAEWGSHGITDQSALPEDQQTVSADQSDHDDPCRTLVVCSDGQRKDRQTPNFGQEITQHNALFDRLSADGSVVDVRDDPLFPFDVAHAILRPPNTPFHPPELS